ncbi:hypothetical protein ACFQ14_11640 [Pseudahrensia aquimaris]|uniref:Uncharacterized protein n=1 Tax=Pseudahrensia aquimaris TaxID=744461 RepID=A0ABW3FHH2_9HYPH
MAGFEDLIRGALAKQADPTPEAREKIYDSARQALQRMLEGNDALAPEVVQAQRVKLNEAIASIEGEYLADVTKTASEEPTPPPPPTAPVAPMPPPVAATPTPAPIDAPAPAPKAEKPFRPEPQISAPTRATPQVDTPRVSQPSAPAPTGELSASRQQPAGSSSPEPSVSRPVAPSIREIPEPPSPPQDTEYPEAYIGDALREKKPYAKILLWVIILVGLGVGGWWVYSNGRALIEQELGGGVPNPPRTFESGASAGAQDEEGWVTVFAPQDNAQNVGTPGAGAAELQQDGTRPIMRLASPDAALTNNLLIRLPRGSMNELQGKSATFELIVRSGGDEDQSFVIFCEFGTMGECGRKRFVAGSNPRPVLFDVLINDVTLGADEDAFISINTDFEGTGRALDLYSIRVRESG